MHQYYVITQTIHSYYPNILLILNEKESMIHNFLDFLIVLILITYRCFVDLMFNVTMCMWIVCLQVTIGEKCSMVTHWTSPPCFSSCQNHILIYGIYNNVLILPTNSSLNRRFCYQCLVFFLFCVEIRLGF
jgi:hypothetical protein